MRSVGAPQCLVLAGPNGAGKTTFARAFLTGRARPMAFMNADLLAAGLSPLNPDLAHARAARLFLSELEGLAADRADFAFETTLSGRGHAPRLRRWRDTGYRVQIVFLRLASAELAYRRVRARVRQGGHPVPQADVARRFARGWENFEQVYRPLADAWAVYDNSGLHPELMEEYA